MRSMADYLHATDPRAFSKGRFHCFGEALAVAGSNDQAVQHDGQIFVGVRKSHAGVKIEDIWAAADANESTGKKRVNQRGVVTVTGFRNRKEDHGARIGESYQQVIDDIRGVVA